MRKQRLTLLMRLLAAARNGVVAAENTEPRRDVFPAVFGASLGVPRIEIASVLGPAADFGRAYGVLAA
jgi:hypothetical protein